MDSFNNFNKRLETIKRLSNPEHLTNINNMKRFMATPSFQQNFQNIQYNLPNIQELTNYEQKWREILSINAKLNAPLNLQNIVKNITRIQVIPNYEQKMKSLIRVNSKINIAQNWQNIANDITRLKMFPNYEQKMQKLMLSIPKSNFEFIKTNEQIISITKFINNTALNYNEIIQKALNRDRQ